MPNWCMQEVYIHGETSMVTHLYWELKDRQRFCDVVLPIPLEVIGQPFDGKGTSPQYNWRCDNWNTKWEVTNIQITEEIVHGDDHYPIPTSYFRFNCWTAWDAPIPVWEKLHELGIEVQAEYEVEGVDVVGEFTLGEHHCRTLTDEEIKEREARWEKDSLTIVRCTNGVGEWEVISDGGISEVFDTYEGAQKRLMELHDAQG